jgi:hypothetical protein
MAGAFKHLVPVEAGWRAVFGIDEEPTLSRVIAWAVMEKDDGSEELVGMIADPNDRAKLIPAPQAVSVDGVPFARYGYRP